MPSNGTKKAKAAKAAKDVEVSAGKDVEVSAGSENGVQEDKVVQSPNLTPDDITKMLRKLRVLTMLNEQSSKLTKSALENSQQKLNDFKKVGIPEPTTLSDKLNNAITAFEIQKIELEVSALSETLMTLEGEETRLNATFEMIIQHNLPNQQHPCQPRPDTSNVIDIFDNIRCEVAAEKVAAEKVAAEKVAAEKVAAEKVTVENVAVEKAAEPKVTVKKVVNSKTMEDIQFKGNPYIWKQALCQSKTTHDGRTCSFFHNDTDCSLFCNRRSNWTCENSACKKDHIQPTIPTCTYGKRCNKEECEFKH
jgi:hypothetical protein